MSSPATSWTAGSMTAPSWCSRRCTAAPTAPSRRRAPGPGRTVGSEWADGYRHGWQVGYEVGHAAAVHEVFNRAEWLAGKAIGTGPSYVELLRRRCEHHPAGCGCLDCARYAAKLAGRAVAA